MRQIALAAVVCLTAGPALAAWQFEDLSNAPGAAYRIWTSEARSDVEIEIYCDDWVLGVLELVIYTRNPSGPADPETSESPMEVRVDGNQTMTVSAFRDELDGEELFFTSNIDIDNFGDLLVMMAHASESIEIAYQGQQFRFGTEELFEGLVDLTENCPD